MPSESVRSNAAEHVEVQIRKAPILLDPFEHCIVDQVFPQNLYSATNEYWPDSTVMKPLSQTGRAVGYDERHVTPLDEGSLDNMEKMQREFWAHLAETLLESNVVKESVRKFSRILAQRLENPNEPTTFGKRILVINDKSRFSLGPHTDIQMKAVSLIFYMPSNDSDRVHGTSLYRPVDPSLRCDGTRHWPFDKFEKIKTVDFIPNRLFMFPRTDKSFHGVEPIATMSRDRRLILVDINLFSSD